MSADHLKNIKTVPMTPDKLPSPPEWVPTSSKNTHEGNGHHSASFKAVLKHNEDLMARLTVSLRRVSHLEKHIEDLKHRLNAERAAADGLRDEVLISVERGRLSDAETQKHVHQISHKDKTIEELKNKVSYLQSECDELKSLKEERVKDLTEKHTATINKIISEYEVKLSNLELHMDHLEKYHHQTQSELKPQFKRMKLLCEKQMDKINQLNQVNQNLTARVKMAQTVHGKTIKSLKENREELRIELRQLKRRFLQTLKDSNRFEKEKDESAQANAELQTQIKKLEAQMGIYEAMRIDLSQKIKIHESEITNKNRKIDELYKVIEGLRTQDGSADAKDVIETVLQGMRNLYFTEEPQPPEASEIVKTTNVEINP